MHLRISTLTAAAALACAAVLASPAPAHAQGKTVRQMFEAANQQLHEALVKGDAAAAAAVYGTKAKLYPPSGEVVSGRAEIQKFWQGQIESGLRGLRITSVEIEAQVGNGTEVSTYEALDKNGNVIDRGKAIVLWKIESGAWRLWRDLWNSSLPATAKSVAPTPLETK